MKVGRGVELEGQGEVPHQREVLLFLSSASIALLSPKMGMLSGLTLTFADWCIWGGTSLPDRQISQRWKVSEQRFREATHLRLARAPEVTLKSGEARLKEAKVTQKSQEVPCWLKKWGKQARKGKHRLKSQTLTYSWSQALA